MNPFANVSLTPAEQLHYAELGYPTLTAAGAADLKDDLLTELEDEHEARVAQAEDTAEKDGYQRGYEDGKWDRENAE